MIRKLLLGAAALSFMAGTSAVISTGVTAAATPVTMTGTITCAFHGSLNFIVPLRDGGHTATNFNVLMVLDHCSGAGTTHGPVTITQGVLTAYSSTTVVNNCGSVTAGTALPTMYGSVAWTATGGTVVPTSVHVTTPYMYFNYNYNLLELGLPTTITKGSYLGQKVHYGTLQSNASGDAYTGQCAAGQGGLQTVYFGQPAGGAAGIVTIKAGL